MTLEHLYEKISRRAPPSFDLEATQARVRVHNLAMVAEWRERYPNAEAAILEIQVRASGHTRRRLNRYSEFKSVRGGQPGLLVFRNPTGFNEVLDLQVVEIIAAAARADVSDIEWRLLTVMRLSPPRLDLNTFQAHLPAASQHFAISGVSSACGLPSPEACL
ncbi:hypothetical protein [Brevundimonas sp.]|uniref:hypothetical protein n=1 Tax=Brevundimonas sp. TaxID=1871086 RepID=UPI003F70291A